MSEEFFGEAGPERERQQILKHLEDLEDQGLEVLRNGVWRLAGLGDLAERLVENPFGAEQDEELQNRMGKLDADMERFFFSLARQVQDIRTIRSQVSAGESDGALWLAVRWIIGPGALYRSWVGHKTIRKSPEGGAKGGRPPGSTKYPFQDLLIEKRDELARKRREASMWDLFFELGRSLGTIGRFEFSLNEQREQLLVFEEDREEPYRLPFETFRRW